MYLVYCAVVLVVGITGIGIFLDRKNKGDKKEITHLINFLGILILTVATPIMAFIGMFLVGEVLYFLIGKYVQLRCSANTGFIITLVCLSIIDTLTIKLLDIIFRSLFRQNFLRYQIFKKIVKTQMMIGVLPMLLLTGFAYNEIYPIGL